MTAAERPRGACSIGWITSLCLHGMMAFGALVVTQRLSLAPIAPPFRWNVAMVAALSEAQPASTDPLPALQPPLNKLQRPPLRTSIPRLNNAPPTGAEAAESVLPASDEPIAATTDISSILPMEGTEQQPANEPVTLPSHEGGSTSASLSQEPPSESRSLYSSTQSSSRPQEAVATEQPASLAPAIASSPRPDYGWLSEIIMRRMEALKRYPADARLDRAEGKVILKAVIKSDGNLETVEVFRSSGHHSLDRAAVDLLRVAAPFQFPRPLEKPQMTVKIPMSYRLEP